MNRLITAANFIHFNMPNGTEYDHPRLSPEEAWDVAAFMVAQPRPHKPGLDRDFPDRLTKPVDTPYAGQSHMSSSSAGSFSSGGIAEPCATIRFPEISFQENDVLLS
jgi:cytochrome c